MTVRGSFFLDHPVLDPQIEAAIKICIDLQERGFLKTTIDKSNEENLVKYELTITESTQR